MTSAPSTPSHIQPTLFAVDFPAKTSAKPERVPAWLAADRACSTNCSESFAWWDRDTSSWKTSQQSLTEGWTTFSERWPRQGMTRNGLAYRQRLWVPAISAIGGGALPTPKASDGERGRDKARLRPDEKGRELATVLRDLLPTPRANSAMTVDLRTQQNRPELQPNLETVMARMLPTPVAQTGQGGPKGLDGGAGARKMLADAGFPRCTGAPARMLPTPTVNDAGNSTLPPSQRGRDSLPGQMLRDDSIPTGAATYLNPSFVSEMMGYPVEWLS